VETPPQSVITELVKRYVVMNQRRDNDVTITSRRRRDVIDNDGIARVGSDEDAIADDEVDDVVVVVTF